MKKLPFLLLSLAIVYQSCSSQTSPKREIYNQDFNWKITIPEDFDTISAQQWATMQNRGAEAIEKTYGEKVNNIANTIFIFKSDQLNYFESNYQPFDTTTDGNYLENCKLVNEMLYQTFMTQMEGVKIDTTTSTDKIDNLEFQTLQMKVTYPNKMVLHVHMFSRLFDKKEFSVNIMYVDKIKGEQMLRSWRNSKFGQQL